jgi:hypothetical protein
MPPRAYSRLRWYQFSLLSLLLVVMILGPILGWLGLWLFQLRPHETIGILGPITKGSSCTVPLPSDAEIMRALETSQRRAGRQPGFSPTRLQNVKIRKWKIAESADPPKVYPLIGRAELHHARYTCTVAGTEVGAVGTRIRRRTVCVDHSHLHMVGDEE